MKSAFESIHGQLIGKHRLQVKFISPSDSIDTANMIFISKSMDSDSVAAIIEKVSGKPVITIGEDDDFINQGGMINFFTRDDRLVFEVNTMTMKRQQIQLSSRLLKLAIIVREN